MSMRPAVPRGEIFASVFLPEEGPVECRLYRAAEPSGPGRPVIQAQRLLPVAESKTEEPPMLPVAPTDASVNKDREHSSSTRMVPIKEEVMSNGSQEMKTPVGSKSKREQEAMSPVARAREENEMKLIRFKVDPNSPVVRVLGVTAIAFFGTREAAAEDGCITLTNKEVEASKILMDTGHFRSDVPTMKKTPVGSKVAEAVGQVRTTAFAPSQQQQIQQAQAVQKPIRKSGHFSHQIKALVRKDFVVMKASRCSFCCEITLSVFTLFIVSMLFLFALRGSMMMGAASISVNSAENVWVGDAFQWPRQVPLFCAYEKTNILQGFHNFMQCTPKNTSAEVFSFMDSLSTTSVVGLTQPSNAGSDEVDFTFTNFAPVGTAIAFVLSFIYADEPHADGTTIKQSFQDYPEENAYAAICSTAAQLILFGLIPAAVRTATRLVDEQREGFREHLRVMGCGEMAYLGSIYLSSFLRTLPTVLLVTILARIIWWDALDSFFIYLVVQFYFMAMTSLCTLMPAFFNSSTWTMVIMLIFTFGSTLFSPAVSAFYPWLQVLICMAVPPCAFWFGLTHALARECIDLSVGYGGALGILIGQTFFFALFAYYLHRLFPGPYGARAHPLFFLRGGEETIVKGEAELATRRLLSKQKDRNTMVEMKKLRKFFGSQREVAAVDLSLSIQRGEILALLGHNGAGKTTTISMLCGLLSATDYEVATVAGLDISNEMDAIRLNIGMCPQHDVLFPYLSAREHLRLFANLRGVDISNNRLDELLMFLELPLDNTKVLDFSGGMKRRVSVCSALVGEPTVVFLDEPTTALDEVSRQKLWELLKIERTKGTTLILTTHMMEEAEKLGDRIAIMSAGELHSEGTAMELKARYGSGYYLAFSKGPAFNGHLAFQTLTEMCPEANLHMDSGAEATYFLPSSFHSHYADILEKVEAKLHEIGATSFGLNMSTLEDVFVSISQSTNDHDVKDTEEAIAAASVDLMRRSSIKIFEECANTSIWLKGFSDAKMIFMKRILSIRYLWFELLLQLVLPLLMLTAAFASVFTPTGSTSESFGYFSSPPPDVVDIPFLDLSQNKYLTPTIGPIISQLTVLTGVVWAGTNFRFHILDKPGDWVLQKFKTTTSLSPFRPHYSEVPFGIFMRGNEGDEFEIELRQKQIPDKYQAFSGEFAALLGKAIALALPSFNHTQVHQLPQIVVKPYTRIVTESPIPTSHSTPQQPQEPQRTTFALLTMMGVLFQTFPVLVVLNDECYRGVRETMQAHGLTSLGYWFGNFMYDGLFAMIFPVCISIGVQVRENMSVFASFGQAVGFFALTMMYCFNMIFVAYMFLVLRPQWKLSSHITVNMAVFFGFLLIPLIVVSIMRGAGLDLPYWYPVLESIIPSFNYFTVVNNGRDFSRFSDPSGAMQLIFIFLFPIFPIAMMVMILNRQTVTNRYIPSNEGIPLDLFVDEDVLAELRRLDGESQQEGRPSSMLAANHIWKKYPEGTVAVKGVSFGVQRGECFGLLGTNGAGKTTCMRMLQLETDPSGGCVTFGDLPPSFNRGIDSARQTLRQGVCQQHDTLTAPLTGEEHLALYLALRLGPWYFAEDWETFIDDVLQMMRLPRNKKVGEYSGGMKRKLAVALAMFTGARIIFLDEPSTGLDPFARRLLWRVITAALSEDTCVLLTTHSMEEADAVCGRISIVADGLMKCIGSSQHLKRRFGTGYLVSLILSELSNPVDVDRGMQERFGSSRPTTIAGPLRQYPIGEVASLSATYRTLEQCESEWRLERYAISQCNLHQVFVTFAENIH